MSRYKLNIMTKTRVLLVDDHALFREGLASIIASQTDFEVVGEANDGLEALVKARELQPDLILMDIEMAGGDGLEATRQIKQELPQVSIVILTVREDEQKLFTAIRNGAQGYLLKNMRAKEILAMLRGVMQGQAAIPPVLASRMLDEFRRLSQHSPSAIHEPLAELTPREHEVLTLVAANTSDKEIAETLYLSLHTVKSHMRNILAKLHVNSRNEAAQYARQHGWV